MGLKEFIDSRKIEKANHQLEKEYQKTIVKGDYQYRYNQEWHGEIQGWLANSSLHGFGVCALDNNKSEYGPIENEINGIPVVSMRGAFLFCQNLKTAPEIPANVKTVEYAFYGCDSLTTAPTIPNGVKNMDFTFARCGSLESPPSIPDGVKHMNCTFWDCSNLLSTTNLPDNVEDYFDIYKGCDKLSIVDQILSNDVCILPDFTTDTDEKGHDGHDEH